MLAVVLAIVVIVFANVLVLLLCLLGNPVILVIVLVGIVLLGMFGVFVIVIIVWVGSMPQPLHKQLTLHEAQAYEGASAFYRCFLPWFMLVLLLAHLISLMLDKSNYWPFAAIAGSFYCYYWALRFYTSCNQIDTTPLMPPFLSISTTEAVAS